MGAELAALAHLGTAEARMGDSGGRETWSRRTRLPTFRRYSWGRSLHVQSCSTSARNTRTTPAASPFVTPYFRSSLQGEGGAERRARLPASSSSRTGAWQ